ncbi:1159_t:CDS:2 [Paraglomus brasilianum]|uniref:1159_t:CDS:1 n=1 Tax=Paraglomus brasilianum TaxID=144538 RepID=A0A9N9AX14_9GLOM|nr:1159_t:CDS:2 [Paraglomus brasilianum]
MARHYSFIFIAISLALIATAAYAQSMNCKTCQVAEQAFISCYGSSQVQFTDPKAMQCLCQSQVLGAYDVCTACEKELGVTNGLSQVPKNVLLSKCQSTASNATTSSTTTGTSTTGAPTAGTSTASTSTTGTPTAGTDSTATAATTSDTSPSNTGGSSPTPNANGGTKTFGNIVRIGFISLIAGVFLA